MMSLLLPLSVTLPLSLPLLNTSTFTPESKNEDLHAGYLQLPAGCTVLITESGVAEGKLIEKGVMPFTFLDYILLYTMPHETERLTACFMTGIMNLKALQDVMSSQSLPYIFPFSQFSFPTDLGFVILAEGKKSAFFQVR
jgi:Mini-chromosome maintenance replisome factor